MSGMKMQFNGIVLHIKHTTSKGTAKVFPEGVYFQQLNAWKNSKLDDTDDVLAAFLDSKSATHVYDEMIATIKETKKKGAGNKMLSIVTLGAAGTGYPAKSVKQIVAEFSPKFAAAGITVGVCSVIVNLGSKTWCDFLWIEFVDMSVAPADYLPSFGDALSK
eukprot:scaffold22127_cov63-Attheya_sp.AAC.3